MKIYYYKNNYYYIDNINIIDIFKDSELSDFQKYNAIKLLTYYLVYNYFSFETLKKNIKKYNIELVEIKLLDNKKNNYLYYLFFDENFINRNFSYLLNIILLSKKHKIINMYIDLLFNNNKYINIIHNSVLYYTIDKMYNLYIKYYKYNKYNKYYIFDKYYIIENQL